VLVFFVLAGLYESWSLPLAVILVVPMCLLSALAQMEVNIFVQVGFAVLVGLATKKAILIVEFARDRQQEGTSRFEAAVDSRRVRLWSILMTSFAFVLGVFPLVIGQGAGAEMRRTLGSPDDKAASASARGLSLATPLPTSDPRLAVSGGAPKGLMTRRRRCFGPPRAADYDLVNSSDGTGARNATGEARHFNDAPSGNSITPLSVCGSP
jgi:hypothetical protein